MITALAQAGSALPVSTYLKTVDPGKSSFVNVSFLPANSVAPKVSSARTQTPSMAEAW